MKSEARRKLVMILQLRLRFRRTLEGRRVAAAFESRSRRDVGPRAVIAIPSTAVPRRRVPSVIHRHIGGRVEINIHPLTTDARGVVFDSRKEHGPCTSVFQFLPHCQQSGYPINLRYSARAL